MQYQLWRLRGQSTVVKAQPTLWGSRPLGGNRKWHTCECCGDSSRLGKVLRHSLGSCLCRAGFLEEEALGQTLKDGPWLTQGKGQRPA